MVSRGGMPTIHCEMPRCIWPRVPHGQIAGTQGIQCLVFWWAEGLTLILHSVIHKTFYSGLRFCLVWIMLIIYKGKRIPLLISLHTYWIAALSTRDHAASIPQGVMHWALNYATLSYPIILMLSSVTDFLPNHTGISPKFIPKGHPRGWTPTYETIFCPGQKWIGAEMERGKKWKALFDSRVSPPGNLSGTWDTTNCIKHKGGSMVFLLLVWFWRAGWAQTPLKPMVFLIFYAFGIHMIPRRAVSRPATINWLNQISWLPIFWHRGKKWIHMKWRDDSIMA